MKPRILVLEDSIERIKWLKDRFDEYTTIEWYETVNDFIKAANDFHRRDEIVLFLLDHDLGGVPLSDAKGALKTSISVSDNWPKDTHGSCGIDAVHMLNDDFQDIPTIVWSINPVGGPKMKRELENKGFVTSWLPFGIKKRELEITIKKLIALKLKK